MLLAFSLSMPRVGSWDGKWSQENKLHVRVRNLGRGKRAVERAAKLSGINFYYNFGDGWSARVSVTAVTAAEARALRRRSAGFCGYDWMIDSILDHGVIRRTMGAMQRRKGRDGRAAFVRLLHDRDWTLDKTRDGIISDDIVAADPNGQMWSIEVKNTKNLMVLQTKRQAMAQASRRKLPWMIAFSIHGTKSWLILRQQGRRIDATCWQEG